LFSTWGRLGFFRFGAFGRRGFAGGLVVPFERSASRVSFVMLLLISVNFDGLLATPQWSGFERARVGIDASAAQTLRIASFVLLTAVICGVFGFFAFVAARWGGHRTGFRDSLTGLLPSVLPIAFGYLVAHNAQYVLVNAQLLGPLVGNPVGLESWPIHLPYPFNDTYEPNATFLPSAFYWYLGVSVIVAVHVIAVILAHRHLADRAPVESKARASEYPWLVAMIAYTAFSLLLIAQPLVNETAPDQAGSVAAPVSP
jgi:magnesium-transporting ATPase (P-type)